MGPRAHGLSSYGMGAWLPHGVWDLSSWTRDWTGAPVLQGRFLTMRPPGKSLLLVFLQHLSVTNPQMLSRIGSVNVLCLGQPSLYPNAWSIVYGTWGITDFFLLPCWRFSLTENWQKRMQKKWKVWPPKPRPLFHLFYLFLAVLDLCCCMGFSLSTESKSYSLLQFRGFTSLAVSCCRAQALGQEGFGICSMWGQ